LYSAKERNELFGEDSWMRISSARKPPMTSMSTEVIV